MSEDQIRGKVARILNRRQLVINRGNEHGVTVGMQFAVLYALGTDILDPDTKEPLGSIPVPKVIVKVVRVEERLSIASTFRRYRTVAGPLVTWADFANLNRPSEVRVETLSTDESTFKQELKEADSFVRVGDEVAEVVEGDEFAGWGP
jgi:hypothetical protein